jgi:hypothetical protein
LKSGRQQVASEQLPGIQAAIKVHQTIPELRFQEFLTPMGKAITEIGKNPQSVPAEI